MSIKTLKTSSRRITELLADFEKNSPSLLIPILQRIQNHYGYIPPSAIDVISRHTRVKKACIHGVITFYAQFYTSPRGKHTIKICRGTACHVKNSSNIIHGIQEFLKVKDGQTTKDMKFTLETVACLGTCFLAPVMMVDSDYYGQLTEKRAIEILKSYR